MQKTQHKPEPIKQHKSDEMADALRGMVTAAEINGGRDNPEVVTARELLAKNDK
jgi:hypothetical protein